MSRFAPLLLFLGLAAAVYLPQSGGQQDIVVVETANVTEIEVEGVVKEHEPKATEPIKPEPVNLAASTDTADEPLEASGPLDISSAASVPGDNALAETEDEAAAEVEDADAVIADAEQTEAGHLPSAANPDKIGPALRELSLFDLKTAAQEHLARLGCYDATIDGIWGSQSRASLQAFNKRMGGDWTEPSAELIQALRAAPAALCERECVADAAGGACAVANKPAAPEDAAKDSAALSYLPPWMRGEELASTAPEGLSEPASVTRDEVVSEPRRRTVRRSYTRRAEEREWARERRPTYRRNDDWTPRGWPGQ